MRPLGRQADHLTTGPRLHVYMRIREISNTLCTGGIENFEMKYHQGLKIHDYIYPLI